MDIMLWVRREWGQPVNGEVVDPDDKDRKVYWKNPDHEKQD